MTKKTKKNPARRYRVPGPGTITIAYDKPGRPIEFTPARPARKNPSRRASKTQMRRAQRAIASWVRSGGKKHTSLRGKKATTKGRKTRSR
jgi:hypothetical protein